MFQSRKRTYQRIIYLFLNCAFSLRVKEVIGYRFVERPNRSKITVPQSHNDNMMRRDESFNTALTTCNFLIANHVRKSYG